MGTSISAPAGCCCSPTRAAPTHTKWSAPARTAACPPRSRARARGIEGGNFSSPVYWNGSVYFAPVAGPVQAFALSNGLLTTTPTSKTAQTYNGRGGTMAISANGSNNGILWTLQTSGAGAPGTLHAYNATDLTKELYNSNQAGTRDTLDEWDKFSTPVIANGEVLVTSVSQLTIYGLLP